METLVKNYNSIYENIIVPIDELINLEAIQNSIANNLPCTFEADVLLPLLTSRKRSSSSRLLKNTRLANSITMLPSNLGPQTSVYPRESINLNPPLIFTVSESFLKWLNESRGAILSNFGNFNGNHYQNNEIEKQSIAFPTCSDEIIQNQTLSNQISDDQFTIDPVSNDSSFFGQVILDSIEHGLSSLDNSPLCNHCCHSITDSSTSFDSSEESDHAREINPNNTVLIKAIPAAMELSMSSEIEDNENTYIMENRISMSRYIVESNNEHLFIFSEFLRLSNIQFVNKE